MITSKDSNEPGELLTVQEIAQRFRVHPATVHGWIRAGKLKAFKVGGRVRVKPERLGSVITREG